MKKTKLKNGIGDYIGIDSFLDKNSIDMDITVGKGSFKESRVKIQFDLPDLKFLHTQYVNQLKSDGRSLPTSIQCT